MTVTNNLSPRLFIYTIEFFDDTKDEVCVVKGLVASLSYAQAAELVEKAYDPDNLISIELCESFVVLDEQDILEQFKV